MALDTAQKRFAVAGNVFPVAAKDGPWRITVGRNVYPVAALAAPVEEDNEDILSIGNSIGRSICDSIS